MKIEHNISSYQGEIISKEAGKAVLKFNKKAYFKDYKNEDFNEHFVVQALIKFDLLEKLSVGHYSVYKSRYLYDKAITQEPIAITGEYADTYTYLCMLKENLKLYDRNPATAEEITAVMKALEKFYPAEKIAETNADPKNIRWLIDDLTAPIWRTFQEKVAPKAIRTYEWKRKKDAQNREVFDYSLPATLFLNTVTFDEKEYKKLDEVVKHILRKYEITHEGDSLIISVEFQNVQPKPKKAKLPPINFESLQGQEISADDYFYGLTKAGWKYDLEESDLFYMLSKTFWSKGIKVCLVLSEHCCIPPVGEETTIEAVDFFKFDKKQLKERTMREKYEAGGYNFDNFEEFKAYFEEQYPLYIPHADLNTQDYELLQKVEIADVPATILKEIWADLHSF